MKQTKLTEWIWDNNTFTYVGYEIGAEKAKRWGE
jgi:hypothetical protein